MWTGSRLILEHAGGCCNIVFSERIRHGISRFDYISTGEATTPPEDRFIVEFLIYVRHPYISRGSME